MSLEVTLQNAISGLQVSQQSLQVVSNNIANVNVEGYTRKIISQTSRVIDGVGYGVDLANITRNVDSGIQRQLRKESGALEELSVRESFLKQVNSFFGRPEDNNSLTHLTSEFASNIDALSVTPETAATQFLAVKGATDVLNELKSLSKEVQRLRSEANRQLDTVISEFNSQLEAVKKLNLQIIEFNASNISTAELEDQRDTALNKLGEMMDIEYFERNDGSLTVFTGSGKTLVDGSNTQPLTYNRPAALAPTLEYTPTNAVNYLGPTESGHPVGGVPGIFVGEKLASTDITNLISSGRMKGLIELRDQDLQAIQKQLDEFSEKLKDEINKIHNQGAGYPPPASLTGSNFVTGDTNIDSATGLFRIGVVDEAGNLIEGHTFDLTNFTTVDELLTDGTNGINDLFGGTSNLTASLTSDGSLQLSAGGNYRVAINELDSSMTGAGKDSRGFSDFFGLNDLISSPLNFSRYRSDAVNSQTSSQITTGGTLQFTADGVDVSVAYLAGDSLSDLETTLNAGLGATNISAEVIADGDVFRLQLTDSTGEDFQIVETGGGTLLSDLGLRIDHRGISTRMSVRTDIVDNSYHISRGALQSNTWQSSTTANSYASATDAIGGAANRTLTFTGTGFSTTVSYNDGVDHDGDTVADTISDAVSAINQNATLQAQGISASVVFDNAAGEYRIKILDSNSDNFDIADDGQLTMATEQGVTIGDGTVAENLAGVFESSVTFNAAPAGGGGLARADATFDTYSASILSFNSAQQSAVSKDLRFQENLVTEIFNKHSSISSVNMDEELASLIIYEQAYLAAARMITVTNELFKELANAV